LGRKPLMRSITPIQNIIIGLSGLGQKKTLYYSCLKPDTPYNEIHYTPLIIHYIIIRYLLSSRRFRDVDSVDVFRLIIYIIFY